MRPRRWGKTLNLDMAKNFLTFDIDQNGNVLNEGRPNSKVSLFIGKDKHQRLKISNVETAMR